MYSGRHLETTMILRRHAKPIKNSRSVRTYSQLGRSEYASPVSLERGLSNTSTASSRLPARLCVNQRCRRGPASKCWVRWKPRLPDAPTIRTFAGLRASLFRFLWKWTQAVDRALRTLWLFGHAHSSAMVLHKMAEANPSFFRYDFCEVGFDFVRIGFFGEA